MEERIECVVSKKVKYSKRDDTILTLPVPLEAATNKGKSLLVTVLLIHDCENLISMCTLLAAEVEAFEAKKKELESKKQRV